MARDGENRPSLENLLESQDLGLEVLHPGGLDITRELAERCHIEKDARVLDVASGTGESACYLAEHVSCQVVGVDTSDYLIHRATHKARERHLNVEFIKGDAHRLPFADNTFDVVFSECTICLLDKESAIREMVRVAKPGGHVGIHDVCWKESTPEHFKQRLAEREGERPETLRGWKSFFEKAGLTNVEIVDKSYLVSLWVQNIKKRLGVIGQFNIFFKVITKWGIKGYRTVRESVEFFQSEHTGYGITVGRKQGQA